PPRIPVPDVHGIARREVNVECLAFLLRKSCGVAVDCRGIAGDRDVRAAHVQGLRAEAYEEQAVVRSRARARAQERSHRQAMQYRHISPLYLRLLFCALGEMPPRAPEMLEPAAALRAAAGGLAADIV